MQKIRFLLLLVVALSTTVLGQDTTGRIVGTVSAADGAVAGATIVARDNQTAKERTVTASGDGTFVIPQLEFGTYTVTVTATGFKSAHRAENPTTTTAVR